MKYTDKEDHSTKNNFRKGIERIIWAHSNLSSEERADVLREFVRELEADESPFDDTTEHVRKTLKMMGFDLQESGLE